MGTPVESTPPPEKRVFRVMDLKRPLARQVFNPKKYADLKADIAANGLLELPHVSLSGDVASGNMRVAVLLDLGVETVGCEVYPHLTSFDALLRHAQRCDIKSDVSRYDLARRLLLYRTEYPAVSQKQMAALFGTSEATVSRRMELLALPDDLVAMLLEGNGPLTLAHVAAVATVADLQLKEALLRRAVAEGLKAKELAAEARPKRGAARTHTERHGRVTVTWERALTKPELKAELDAFWKFIEGRVRQFDPAATPVTAVIGKVAS